MSWQSYVDNQLLKSQKVKHAVICGHNGAMWACSSGFPVTKEELKILANKYEDIGEMSAGGLKVGGQRYMYLSSDNDRGIVRGKLGTSGIHCVKTKQTYIICTYEGLTASGFRITHEEVAAIAEKLGVYLVGVGF